MIKTLLNRAIGLLVAVVAIVPGAVSLLKDMPSGFVHALHVTYWPYWWWQWVWGWMPALKPITSCADLFRALPGIAALGCVGVGLAIAFGSSKKNVKRRWEEQP